MRGASLLITNQSTTYTHYVHLYPFAAPRSTTSCPGPNNLPPLQFHQVHGDNIRICRDGTMAKRYESFCKGIAFSARPVKTNERVYVKFSEISNNWSGVIRFGFTYNDPATLRNSLPKYACPDLTNRPGYWAKALNERFCERDNILFYYVTAAGDVHFGVNGEEKGVFITGVETRGPLWTLIDIYGNCTAVEFLDSRVCQMHPSQGRRADREIDRIQSAFQSLNVAAEEHPSAIVNRPCSSVTNNAANEATGLIPIPFHRTKGRNVMLSSDRFVATRADSEFCQGYVFTARPLKIGEKIIVQILRTEHMYVGAMALGLTSCDPASLQAGDLPDDADMLLDRPEYWVVSKDVAATPNRGDEIMFCVTPNGEVQISKNRGPATVVMHVDQSLQLWAFLDVYGSTQSVRILSQSPNPASMTMSPRRLQVQLPSSESISSLNSHASLQHLQQQQQQQHLAHQQQHNLHQVEMQRKAIQMAAAASASSRLITNGGDMIQIQPGGTVLVVNLPPTQHSSVSDLSASQPSLAMAIPQQQQPIQQQQPQQQHQQMVHHHQQQHLHPAQVPSQSVIQSQVVSRLQPLPLSASPSINSVAVATTAAAVATSCSSNSLYSSSYVEVSLKIVTQPT